MSSAATTMNRIDTMEPIHISAFLLTSSLGFTFIVAGFLLAAPILESTSLFMNRSGTYAYIVIVFA